jgi:hypothetical protein
MPDFDDAYLEDVKHEVAEKEERDLEARANGITHERPPPTRLSLQKNAGEEPLPRRSAYLILEGPYGGPTLRPSDFERVRLFAGGSGAMLLGVLDELMGRCVRLGRRGGEKTRRVVWCWCRVLPPSFPRPLLNSAPR